jgi:hypothetical protein
MQSLIELLSSWGLNVARLDLVIKVIATGVAGVWVYFTYRRDHRPRLQLRVSAERTSRDGLEFLSIKTELSNVGPARVRLEQAACGLEICAHRLPPKFDIAMQPRWELCSNFDLFEDQHWIEASGLIIDQHLFALPRYAERHLRIRAKVTSTRRPRPWSRDRRIGWTSTVTVGRLSPEPAMKRAGDLKEDL